MAELEVLAALMRIQLSRLGGALGARKDDERGSNTIEIVIIISVVAALAIAAGLIIRNAIINKANSVGNSIQQ